MSTPLLKYAVLATYLEPTISNYELISSLQFQFPPFIQRILATAPVQTVQDAVDVLKRLDMMGDHDPAPRPNLVSPPRTNPAHPFQSLRNERTQENKLLVRQTYYSRASDFTRSGRNSPSSKTKDRSNFGNRAERQRCPRNCHGPRALRT